MRFREACPFIMIKRSVGAVSNTALFRRGKWTYGEELRESAEQKAERLVKTALRQRGWKEGDLAKRRKGDPVKIKIALQLREQGVMTMEWIAQRLQMGTRT